MHPDQIVVIGLLLIVLAIPSMIRAYADGRPPRVASVVLLSGMGLGVYAQLHKPGGYDLAGLAEAVYVVIGDLLR